MIRLGNYLLNEEAIEIVFQEEPGVLGVKTQGGDVHYIPNLTVDDVHRMLFERGLMEPLVAEVVSVVLTPREKTDLQKALDDGFLFAAKDVTGQVFAYEECVEKGDRCWLHKASNRVMRLHGEFAALSFEDEYPLDIAAALEVDA